jgi:hypothetical protein
VVEPPWMYDVIGDEVRLDAVGNETSRAAQR